MGKHLISSMNSTVQFHDNHPGCMWGILHILNYHHWHNIRNVFPLKKHYRGRHTKSYKRKRLLHNHVEDQQIEFAEAEPLLVRQFGKKWSDTSKSSPKRSNKRTHSENMSKENSKGWSGQKQVISQLLHLEKDGKIAEAILDQKLMEAKKLNHDTLIKSKRHSDVLEVLGVDKDLLLKFLQDLNVGGENLQPASNDKARLTKSGSVPQTLQMRSISPITFGHKQKEVWPLHKGGKDISYVKPKQKQSLSSSSSNSLGLNHKGWNQSVPYRFKVIKQKIKHALMELKKSGYQTSVEAIRHRASSEYLVANNDKGASQSSDGDLIQEYIDDRISYETHKASDCDSSIHEIRSMRRTSSLNESLDRYTQLFEQSFSKDIKLHSSMSKSLKLPNEDKSNMSLCPPKASRRNLSLPNLDSFSFLILHEALSDANEMGMTVEETNVHVQRKLESFPLNKDISLDHIVETEMEKIEDSSGNDVKPTLEDGNSPQDHVETSMAIYHSKQAMETLETSHENNRTSHAEGRELNARGSNMDELETDSHNTNAAEKGTKVQSNTGIDSDFEYVRDVLEFLGFTGNESTQMWHTLDQSLKLSLLNDLDKSWFHENESSGEENLNTNHHLLLFNVAKEVLLEIYETSPTYFPFSFKRCLIPMHKGNHLLNEVWTRVNSYLSLRPELDQTLDDVVGRDLAKGKGWMNLQQEEECVALELEEMILKDLLDEVIFS